MVYPIMLCKDLVIAFEVIFLIPIIEFILRFDNEVVHIRGIGVEIGVISKIHKVDIVFLVLLL